MKSVTILAALLGIALSLPAPAAKPPSPMLPGARTSCDKYFLASPGVSCWSMATEHGLTIDEFVRINPQVPSAGGCEGGGIQPHFWYCVKDGSGPGPEQAEAEPTFYRPAPIKTPPPKPSPTKAATTPPAPPPAPAPTPKAELSCEVDRCYRGFLKVVPRLRDTYSRFCSDLLDNSCTAGSMADLGAPAIISNECPQDQPCQAVSSACACYLAGSMGEGPQATGLPKPF